MHYISLDNNFQEVLVNFIWGESNMKFEYRDEYIKLGLKVSYYRRLRGLSQEQLAERIGKNPSYIGQVEAPNIAQAISLGLLFDIAKTLGVPAYKFLDFEDD